MVVVVILARDIKCYLCGAVSGRLLRRADAPRAARPVFEPAPACESGPRFNGRQMVCYCCGGSLYLDASCEEIRETQKEFPRERRGRPPRGGRRDVGGR